MRGRSGEVASQMPRPLPGQLGNAPKKPVFRTQLLGGDGVSVWQDGDRIETKGDGTHVVFRLVRASEETYAIAVDRPQELSSDDADAVLAALEFMFATSEPDLTELRLDGSGWLPLLPRLKARGIAVSTANGQTVAFPEMVWQLRSGWMRDRGEPFPQFVGPGDADGPPYRPPKPSGVLYARFIPWLDGVLSFEAGTMDDLPLLHRWLNDPFVDQFWHEAGPIERHALYLENQCADPHTIPLVGRFDGKAFAYFEVYWAAESIIGPFYDADAFDRGWHVLVGEEGFRGRQWISAWLPSLMHMIFLDDPRTQRIVGEPQADHHRQIRNLLRSGFEVFDTVDLPNKRAALVSLSRTSFFGGSRWRPAAAV